MTTGGLHDQDAETWCSINIGNLIGWATLSFSKGLLLMQMRHKAVSSPLSLVPADTILILLALVSQTHNNVTLKNKNLLRPGSNTHS